MTIIKTIKNVELLTLDKPNQYKRIYPTELVQQTIDQLRDVKLNGCVGAPNTEHDTIIIPDRDSMAFYASNFKIVKIGDVDDHRQLVADIDIVDTDHGKWLLHWLESDYTFTCGFTVGGYTDCANLPISTEKIVTKWQLVLVYAIPRLYKA